LQANLLLQVAAFFFQGLLPVSVLFGSSNRLSAFEPVPVDPHPYRGVVVVGVWVVIRQKILALPIILSEARKARIIAAAGSDDTLAGLADGGLCGQQFRAPFFRDGIEGSQRRGLTQHDILLVEGEARLEVEIEDLVQLRPENSELFLSGSLPLASLSQGHFCLEHVVPGDEALVKVGLRIAPLNFEAAHIVSGYLQQFLAEQDVPECSFHITDGIEAGFSQVVFRDLQIHFRDVQL